MVASEREATAEGARRPVIVVVEDVVLVRLLIADSLRTRGFEVIEAADGVDAVKALEAELPVQIIMSDIHMPGAKMDGIELARWVQAHRPGLPVVLGSGVYSELADADVNLCRGPLLLKPYNFDMVEKRLRAVLEHTV
jgi:CheY-like chemotaxis protein